MIAIKTTITELTCCMIFEIPKRRSCPVELVFVLRRLREPVQFSFSDSPLFSFSDSFFSRLLREPLRLLFLLFFAAPQRTSAFSFFDSPENAKAGFSDSSLLKFVLSFRKNVSKETSSVFFMQILRLLQNCQILRIIHQKLANICIYFWQFLLIADDAAAHKTKKEKLPEVRNKKSTSPKKKIAR